MEQGSARRKYNTPKKGGVKKYKKNPELIRFSEGRGINNENIQVRWCSLLV
jgi:hypothetical protein